MEDNLITLTRRTTWWSVWYWLHFVIILIQGTTWSLCQGGQLDSQPGMSTDLRSLWQGGQFGYHSGQRDTIKLICLQFGNHWKGVKFDEYSDPGDNFMITLTGGTIWQSFDLDDIWTLGQGVQLDDHFCKGDNLLSLCQWGQYAIILTRGTIWQSLWHGCNLITLERETTWQLFW